MQALIALIGLAGFAAVIAGLALLLPVARLRERKPLAKWLLIGGASVFVIAVAVSPPPPSQEDRQGEPTIARNPKPPPSPPSPNVRVESYSEPILNMTIDGGATERNGKVIERDLAAILQVGHAASKGRPPVPGSIDAINFTLLGQAGPDQSVGRKLMHLTVKMATLKRLATSGASGVELLNAATDIGWWRPANDDVMRSYCDTARAAVCATVS